MTDGEREIVTLISTFQDEIAQLARENMVAAAHLEAARLMFVKESWQDVLKKYLPPVIVSAVIIGLVVIAFLVTGANVSFGDWKLSRPTETCNLNSNASSTVR